MKKSKSTLVTVIMSVMFAVIYGGLFLLYKPGFIILTVVLTAYGFFRGTSDFHGWLCEDEPLKPAAPTHTGKQLERSKHSATTENRKPFFDIALDVEPQTARR